MQTEYVYNIYNELKHLNKSSAADRARGAAMVMEHNGDMEMADTLRLLSGQLDFDDSAEAEDAIKRTNAKLDKLIEAREKHHSSAYVSSVTDDMILALSGGEVTDSAYSSVTSSFLRHGLFDPDIFGGSGRIPYFDDEHHTYPFREYGTGMGHIKLPCHVVLESDYLLIAHLLGKKKEDIAKIVEYNSVVVSDPGNSDLETGAILSVKDFADYTEQDVSGITGGDAVYDMLKSLGYSDQPERLAFRIIPVVSPTARPMAYSVKEDIYYCDPLNQAYEKIITLSQRLLRLQELGTPEIIINNEKRMINVAVNELDKAIAKRNAKRLCKNNCYAIHNFYQCMLAGRHNIVGAVHILPEKLSEIESLGIYPATIRVKAEDDTYQDVEFSDIIDTCDDAMYQFAQDYISPDDAQTETDEAEKEYQHMESVLDAIFDGARKQREAFTVHLDPALGMYVPYESNNTTDL